MPAMKICGGDLDPIGYEVTSCPKGTKLKMSGLEKRKRLAGKNIQIDHSKV